MEENLIAPCGMNCEICISYLARENDINSKGFNKRYCPGCLMRITRCTLMHCEILRKGKVRFCFECVGYPCDRLIQQDKRYSTKYHMSMIENLEAIKNQGIDEFLEKQEVKWQCARCGGVICCHNGLCLNCDVEKMQKNKKYRWGEE